MKPEENRKDRLSDTDLCHLELSTISFTIFRFLIEFSILLSDIVSFDTSSRFILSHQIQFLFQFIPLTICNLTFLVACTRLYNPLCPSARWSVGWSHFTFFYDFISLTSLLLPKWSCDLKYGPCPPARGFGSRVSGLVFFLIPYGRRCYVSCKSLNLKVIIPMLYLLFNSIVLLFNCSFFFQERIEWHEVILKAIIKL